MSNVLDNPVWHALVGPHAHIANGVGLARHYPRDIAPFSGIEMPSAAAYADLKVGLPSGTEARLFGLSDEPVPGGVGERCSVSHVADGGETGPRR